MDELLKSVLGGMGGGQQQEPQSNNSSMAGLLGGLLGGGLMQPAQSGGMGDLLGMVLGSGNQAGGMAAILGAVMGANNTADNPFVEALVQKLGLSPAVAQVIVSFFMTKVMTLMSGSQAQSSGFSLDKLLNIMGNDKAVESHLQSSGMSDELAQHAGIDSATAMSSLQELVKVAAARLQQ